MKYRRLISIVLLIIVLIEEIIQSPDVVYVKAENTEAPFEILNGTDSASVKEVEVQNSASEIWDGSSIKAPKLIGYEYKIYCASELAWFAQEVNSGNDFEGKSIYISGNINLDGHKWIVIGLSNADNPIEIKGSIIIQNTSIEGLYIAENDNCNGLFGSVLLNDILVDNLSMNNVIIEGKSYGGFLFGSLQLSRNGKCVIENSSFNGKASYNSSCGALSGQYIAGGDNSQINIVNCKFDIISNEAKEVWYGQVNSALKAGIIARCYANSNRCAIVMNGVDCNVNLKSIDQYGYHSSVAGGMIGILEGNANVYMYQCKVTGKIVSNGYCGYAGGIIAEMVSCNIYKQSDCMVTVDLESYWNAYGFQWNSAGFIGSIIDQKPDGFIRNSYYAGLTYTGLAFISKDKVKGDKLKIYNSYYDMNLMCTSYVNEEDAYHADFGCFKINGTTVNCNKYSTNQMGIVSNFNNWDFDSIWFMGDKYPELRLSNFDLPDDFKVNGIIVQDSEIVKTVREYTSNEMYEQWEEIWNGDYSEDVKMEKIINLALYYGITDPKEGLEFVVKSHEKRWAYNELISDDMYTASNFLSWLDNGGRLLIGVDGLAFNQELGDWVDIGTYIKDEYPGVKKYKNMLYDFMEYTSNSNELLNDIKTATKLASNLTSIEDKAYVKNMLKKLNSDKLAGEKGRKERWDIIDEMDKKGVFIEYKLQNDNGNITIKRFLDESSGFGQFAKAVGIAKNAIDYVDMTISDINDLALVDSKLQTYYQYEHFLDDILQAKDIVPYELWCAAQQVKDELNDGYFTPLETIAEQVLTNSKITKDIKKDICKSLGVESFSEWLSVLNIEAWFFNQVVDIGKMVKQAAYTEGYAQLANLYKKRLLKSEKAFLNSMTDENAWQFYYDYNMLYNMRYKGEQTYLEIHNIKGMAKSLFDKGYNIKKEVTEEILNNLKTKCKFDLSDNVQIPESMQYLSKLTISCPVNVTIYSNSGDVIAMLKDKEEQDISNDYGRFVVQYNLFTGDYDKVVYLSREDVTIEALSYDDGLVDMIFSHLNDDGKAVIKHIYNKPQLKDSKMIINPTEIRTDGNIDVIINDKNEKLKLDSESDSYVDIESAELSSTSLFLTEGESRLLNINVQPANASIQNVTWASSDSDIVSVQDGRIIANKDGKAVIYAFLHDSFSPVKCNVVCDSTPPVVNISTENCEWNRFNSYNQFNSFFKNRKEIKISATDNMSPDINIRYLLSDKNMTIEELHSDDVKWMKYEGTIELPANSKQFIYAKAVDEVGNESIVNSDGIVVYTDARVEKNNYEYIKNVSEDLSVAIDFNGNTIKSVNYDSYELIKGKDYIVGDNGVITFLSEYMDTLSAQDKSYEFTIHYNPYGEDYILNDRNEEPDVSNLFIKVNSPKLISKGNINVSIEVANGTDKEVIASYLEKEIPIVTQDNTVNSAKIQWNFDRLEKYNSSILKEQVIEIKGQIELPEGIINSDNIDLNIKKKIVVVAAGIVSSPINDLATGTYKSDQVVELNSDTQGADIYYTIDGSEPDEYNGIKYTKPIELVGIEGESVEITIKAIALKGRMQNSKVVTYKYVINIPDTVSPQVNISNGSIRWDIFNNDSGFKTFSRQPQYITISASDNVTQNVKVFYYLSDEILSKQEITKSDINWLNYANGFYIKANCKKFVYAKAVDEAGNETIVNSDGIVIYTDAEIEKNNYEYIKNVSGDISIVLELNENTIKSVNYDNYELLNGKDYIVGDNGVITFLSEYMDTLASKDISYEFTIKYNPYGEDYILSDKNEEPAVSIVSIKVNDSKSIVVGKLDDNINSSNKLDNNIDTSNKIDKKESYQEKEAAINEKNIISNIEYNDEIQTIVTECESEESVDTNDIYNTKLWISLLLLSMFDLLVIYRKKHKSNIK